MPRVSSIQYNPSLTVKENAIKNGVSEAAIRYYIKTHDIDRRFDRKLNVIEDCRKYLKKHPKASWNEVQKKTGHSLSTIRQYREYITTEKELIDFDSNKAKKRHLRQINNYYATHPSVTQDILREENFNRSVLEPFCGSGIMADVIKKNGYEVEAYDIVDRGYGKVGDFFSVDYPVRKFDIITNPPYDDNLIEIVKRCLALCKDKVAILLPMQYLSGKERHSELYSKYPPSRVYIYCERINIAKDGDFEKFYGANMTIYAWYVWERGYQGTTELKWIHNDNKGIIASRKRPDATELKSLIEELETVERNNTEELQHLPTPSVADLTRWEEYDASKFLCVAFRKKTDYRKGLWIPFGNMNSDFPFKLGDYTCLTSESAYICGMFSNNTPEHVAIQEELLAEPNGRKAKKDIRHRNESLGRKDWYEFNVMWMLYVVWTKVQRNQHFRELLLAVPEGATIIEDTTFQHGSKDNDTTAFWGAKNNDRKDYATLLKKYHVAVDDDASKRQIADELNDFTDYGVFRGRNVMGKILTICKQCLHDGTEPDIDYELLKRKRIHLLGSIMTF